MPLNTATDGMYEGWAVIGGVPYSTGVFNVDAMGHTVDPGTGDPIDVFHTGLDLSGTTDIKITLEPAGDSDPAPSGLVVLEGGVMGDEAQLVPAIPGYATLSAAMGCYILASPSDNSVDTTNDNQGMWFLCMPGPVAGLTGLPDLGPNWTYEGWVVDVSGARRCRTRPAVSTIRRPPARTRPAAWAAARRSRARTSPRSTAARC